MTPRDPNGGVKVVGLGTDHRLPLAQNPVVRGNVARPLASASTSFRVARRLANRVANGLPTLAAPDQFLARHAITADACGRIYP